MPTDTPSGPLLLPLPHHLGERLKVHKTSEKWLLAGLSDQLDALRESHIERRTRLAEARQEQIDLGAKFAREDAEHHEKLVQAARERNPEPEDTRTSPEQRHALRVAAQERLEAAAEVLAETCDKVVATLREQEPTLLRAQRQALVRAEQLRRELEAKMQAARADLWHAEAIARWLKNQADDEAWGGQPAPTPTVPPERWQPSAVHFERHFTDPQIDRREIDAMAAVRLREIQEARGTGDPTGLVSDLEPTA